MPPDAQPSTSGGATRSSGAFATSTPPERRRGHADGSVQCLAFAHACPADAAPSPTHLPILASGGEDGTVCVHDLRCPAAGPPAARAAGLADGGDDDDDDDAGVTALAWGDSGVVLYAGVGRRVLRLDARTWEPAPGLGVEAVLHAAPDEVGGLAQVTLAGSSPAPALAVADDTGTVSLLRDPAGDGPWTASPLLPRVHTNLASAVLGRPGEVVSGGFDCVVARWDAVSRRLIAKWEVGACVALAQAGGAADGGAGEDGTTTTPTPPPSLNPPFVHALAAPPSPASPAAPLPSLAAAALGDGSILLLDVDAPAAKAGSIGPAPGRPGARAVRKNAAGRSPKTPDPRLPAGVLGALPAAHTRAVTSIAFTSPSDSLTSPWLASGGDDGRVAVWDWRAGCGGGCAGLLRLGGASADRCALWEAEVGEASGRTPLLGSVDNGRKIQALAAGPGGVVAVGDTGRRVGVFRVVG